MLRFIDLDLCVRGYQQLWLSDRGHIKAGEGEKQAEADIPDSAGSLG
jgi:hypothetical protein